MSSFLWTRISRKAQAKFPMPSWMLVKKIEESRPILGKGWLGRWVTFLWAGAEGRDHLSEGPDHFDLGWRRLFRHHCFPQDLELVPHLLRQLRFLEQAAHLRDILILDSPVKCLEVAFGLFLILLGVHS